MLIIRGQGMAILMALFFTSQTAAAQTYNYPLHSEAIGDAYFLGERNNFQTTDCLLQYIHRFTGPQAGRYYISEVDISTPYQQIVLRGQRDTPGDSALQAETDLGEHPLKLIARVQVEWNSGYSDRTSRQLVPPDLSKDVSIHVSQGREITPLKTTHQGMYRSSGHSGSVFVGWLFELQFDPAKITSEPLRISVKTPDGQVQEAEFDMAKIQ